MNYTVVSLFTGCGGLDYGFAKMGFNIIFANDFNNFACETYHHNFQNIFSHNTSYLIHGDINNHFNSIPDGATLLIGGAPCQSWSLMGNRQGADDERGKLFFKTVDVLEVKKPKYFIFENVKGLLSHDGGQSFSKLLKKIAAAGYEYHYKTFNMSEYGVSQRRERVIIFGKQIGSPLDLSQLHPIKNTTNTFILDELLKSIPSGLSNSETTSGIGKSDEFGKILKPGENLKNISDAELLMRFANIGVIDPPKRIKGFRPVYKLHSSTVAPTMVFNAGTNVPYHPWQDRRLTVREAATIQGFPLDFEFKGPIVEQYKQVANAVPPIFSIQLAQQFLNQVTKGDK